MSPLLIEIGPFPVYTFGLMVALALFAGVIKLQDSFAARGIDPKLAERYVIWGGVSGIVGARLWYVLENWEQSRQDFSHALLSNAGFTFYGGFIVATAVIIWRTRRDKIPLAQFADSLPATLALGYAIGRIGCQLSGDGDYGIPVNNWLGMSYSTGVVPTVPGQLVYPTPLYESVAAILIAYIFYRMERKGSKGFGSGSLFGLYLVLMSIERFLIEFIRPNAVLMYGLSEAQVIAVGLFVIGFALAGIGVRRKV